MPAYGHIDRALELVRYPGTLETYFYNKMKIFDTQGQNKFAEQNRLEVFKLHYILISFFLFYRGGVGGDIKWPTNQRFSS